MDSKVSSVHRDREGAEGEDARNPSKLYLKKKKSDIAHKLEEKVREGCFDVNNQVTVGSTISICTLEAWAGPLPKRGTDLLKQVARRALVPVSLLLRKGRRQKRRTGQR